MIAIIDYGVGNLRSIQNMITRVGASAVITSMPEEIERADKLILPGVGAFGKGMRNLTATGLVPLLREKVLEQKTPILGICLGMQLFGLWSEENDIKGLSWISAKTVRFRFSDSGLKRPVPHMGWNFVQMKSPDLAGLIIGESENPRFYFVHSYHLECDDDRIVMATTSYGYDFPAIIKQGNILGVQFHPEKSHKHGMQVLTNFSKLLT